MALSNQFPSITNNIWPFRFNFSPFAFDSLEIGSPGFKTSGGNGKNQFEKRGAIFSLSQPLTVRGSFLAPISGIFAIAINNLLPPAWVPEAQTLGWPNPPHPIPPPGDRWTGGYFPLNNIVFTVAQGVNNPSGLPRNLRLIYSGSYNILPVINAPFAIRNIGVVFELWDYAPDTGVWTPITAAELDGGGMDAISLVATGHFP